MESSKNETTDWARGICIGRGCFGTINMAVDKSNGQIFAVKSIDGTSCLAAQADALENEIKILRSISSPWVIKYFSDDITMENETRSFRNLHMEYMPGGTAAEITKDEKILRSRVYCIVAGLKQVHSMGIVHCDIKGKNVLISSSPAVAKLADFGSASFVTEDNQKLVVPRGSPLWMAPEVVRGEYQGPESDVWSMGCTVVEMITGNPPWEESGLETLLRIGYSDELPKVPTQISELGKDFLNKCLRRDRKERWTCDQLLSHPFVDSFEPLNHARHASPRCVLDWPSLEFSDNEELEEVIVSQSGLAARSISGRIGILASNAGANWESDGWVQVRNVINYEHEGTNLEYSDSSRADLEIQIDTEQGYSEVNDFSWMHKHEGFTVGEKIIYVNLISLTAIVCTSIWFTLIKLLQLFRFVRLQSSHVATLPSFLTLCAVFLMFCVFFTFYFIYWTTRFVAKLRIQLAVNYHMLWASMSIKKDSTTPNYGPNSNQARICIVLKSMLIVAYRN